MITTDIWCGLDLKYKEKEELIKITLAEFNKPIKDRKRPFQLIDKVKGIVRKYNWQTNKKRTQQKMSV